MCTAVRLPCNQRLHQKSYGAPRHSIYASPRRVQRHSITRNSTLREDEPTGTNRDSSPLVALLATCGFAETAYLAALSLTGQSDKVACPLSAESCSTVLTSDYAYLFDTIPLSLLGSFVYGAVALLALQQVTNKDQDDNGNEINQADNSPLVYLSTLLVGTSTYLAVLLATKFSDTPCMWCMASIALSFGIGGSVLAGVYHVATDRGV